MMMDLFAKPSFVLILLLFGHCLLLDVFGRYVVFPFFRCCRCGFPFFRCCRRWFIRFEPNREKLTDTGCCGKQNCDGLYFAATNGVLSSTLCPIVQKNSGPECCNLAIASGPFSEPNASPSISPLRSSSHSPSDAPSDIPSSSASSIPAETPVTPYSKPTDDPTPNICNQCEQKKACITTFGCRLQKKKRKRKGKCKTALETAQCSSGKKRSWCMRKGCVWRKSDKRCLGRWS